MYVHYIRSFTWTPPSRELQRTRRGPSCGLSTGTWIGTLKPLRGTFWVWAAAAAAATSTDDGAILLLVLSSTSLTSWPSSLENPRNPDSLLNKPIPVYIQRHALAGKMVRTLKCSDVYGRNSDNRDLYAPEILTERRSRRRYCSRDLGLAICEV